MTALFVPPTTDGWAISDIRDREKHSLWRWYGAWETGQTVWQDSQGVWHTDLVPYLGAGRHVVHGPEGSPSTVTTEEGLATAQAVYLGGHTHIVTDDQADELESAGFTVLHPGMQVNKTVGAFASTQDRSSFHATNEIDARVFAVSSIENWGPFFLSNHLVGQWGDPDSAWVASIHPGGLPRLAVSTDGEDLFGPQGTVPTGIPANTPGWHRQQVVLDDGDGNRRFRYYNFSDGETWDLLEEIVEVGTLAPFDAIRDLTVPGSNGALPWLDTVFFAEVIIDGKTVAAPDFRILKPGTTSFTDSAGRLWTLNGAAEIVDT